jgi:SWI/SNF-related matrix-associated actin-dependent regulator of chromatin subfamily A-like protein 1
MSNTIIKKGNCFEVSFPFSSRIIEGIRTIPSRRFDAAKKAWIVNEMYEAELKEFARRYQFNFGSSKEPEMFIPALPPMPELTADIPLKMTLFPYQRHGVAYGLQYKRIINGDEPGLGKTAQAIATITAANAFPCLVICPSSLKINWLREWEMWTNKRAKIVNEQLVKFHERFAEADLAVDVWIVNYESLQKYFVAEINIPPRKKLQLNFIKFWPLKDMFKSVVIDEFHRCKTNQTKQSKLVKGLAAGKEYILGLTGTPVVNKPKDLVSQLSIIGQLTKFEGGYPGFMKKYCDGPGEASNLKELNYRLLTNCLVRREKREVLKDLPAKLRQLVYCTIDTRKEYTVAEESLEQYLKAYKDATDEQIQRSMRGEIMVRIGILKNISARGKMHDVSEFIDDTIESGEKLVIFAHLKEVFAKLKEKYPKAVTITGEDSNLDRQLAIDRFQNDPLYKLIFCSIKAAGVGITLTASSRVAFIELPWHAADAEQCEDRCHRIGQKDSVQCTYFLGNDTIDQWIYNIIDNKRGVANAIMGKETDIETSIVDNIINLFNNKKDKA